MPAGRWSTRSANWVGAAGSDYLLGIAFNVAMRGALTRSWSILAASCYASLGHAGLAGLAREVADYALWSSRSTQLSGTAGIVSGSEDMRGAVPGR